MENRDEDLLSDDSLPKWLQWLDPGAWSLFGVSHVGAGSQGFGPSSTAFPGHKQKTGWEVGPPGLEPAYIWDPGALKAKTLATKLPHGVHNFLSYHYIKMSYCKICTNK